MSLQIKNGGAFSPVNTIAVNVTGSWKQAKEGWIKRAGTWSRFFVDSSPELFVAGRPESTAGISTSNCISKNSLIIGNSNPAFSVTLSGSYLQTEIKTAIRSGNSLYIGGDFKRVNGVDRTCIAKVNINTGALDLTFNPLLARSPTISIETMAISGSVLYIGGLFDTVNGIGKANLAKIDSISGTLYSNFPVGGTSVQPQSMCISGDYVYVVGAVASSRTKNYHAGTEAPGSWNPETKFVFGTTNSTAVCVAHPYIYVGNNNSPYLLITHPFDGTGGDIGGTFNGPINVIASSGDRVIVGGDFTGPKNYICSFLLNDGTSTSYNPAPNNSVYSILISGSNAYFGGSFTTINGTTRYTAAAVNATGGLLGWNANKLSNQNAQKVIV